MEYTVFKHNGTYNPHGIVTTFRGSSVISGSHIVTEFQGTTYDGPVERTVFYQTLQQNRSTSYGPSTHFGANDRSTACLSAPSTTFQLDFHFHMVVCLGTTLAICGILGNTLLLSVFFGIRKYRKGVSFFLGCCALFDILLDAGYLMTMTSLMMAKYVQSETIYGVYHFYIREISTATHIFKAASTFCLIAASEERFRSASHWTFGGYSYRLRLYIVLFVVGLAVMIRAPTYIEFDIVRNPACDNFVAKYQIITQIPNSFVHWLKTILTTLIPFTILIYYNIGIVVRLHRQKKTHMRRLMMQFAMGEKDVSKQDAKIRHALKTLVAIVGAYLLSNILGAVLSVWESIDMHQLQTEYRDAYKVATDLSIVLGVAGNVVRPPIYAICDPDMRRDLLRFVLRFVLKPIGWALGDSPHNPTKLHRILSSKGPHIEDGVMARLQRFNTRIQQADTPPATHKMTNSFHLLRAMSVCIVKNGALFSTSAQNTPLQTRRQFKIAQFRNGGNRIAMSKSMSGMDISPGSDVKCGLLSAEEKLSTRSAEILDDHRKISLKNNQQRFFQHFNTINVPIIHEPNHNYYAQLIIDAASPKDGTLV